VQNTINQLRKISAAPTDKASFDHWLRQEDALAFLVENLREQEFVVYAGLGHTFVHSVTVPATLVDPPDFNDLLAWNFHWGSSWSISRTFSDPPVISVEPPLSGPSGSKIISAGEQLIFPRSFVGRHGDANYFEILQKFTHLFDLHFLPEREAFCRLDKLGNNEEVIRIVSVAKSRTEKDGTIIIFDRAVLDDYAALTDSVIVRMFDFTRHDGVTVRMWSDSPEETRLENKDLFYRFKLDAGHASYSRGCQIIRPSRSKDKVIKPLRYEDENRKYCSFIIFDWKNKIVVEISSAPGVSSNYFTTSTLPFEMSPAFFNPEVLAKYKADSRKYRLSNRSVSCRGAWDLKTYDINEAGQVHTYLVYLRDLPYEEQLHWRAHNERPKGLISQRAFTTDFKGEMDLDYDPLRSLLALLTDLSGYNAPWWKLRSDELLNQVHYPVTTSADEWTEAILRLDQLVVEGLDEKWLRTKAAALGCSPDARLRSIRLLEVCLVGIGFEPDHAKEITQPLHDVHELRNKLKGHATGVLAIKIRQEKLRQHGTFKKHFEVLSQGCDEALRTIRAAFNELAP
jgi:hypothetical protein